MFMLCCRFEQLDTVEKQCGGEGVSQSPLKDKAFAAFPGRNPPFELRRKMGFASDKSLWRRLQEALRCCAQV
jgi:hypothetical protein